MNTPQCKDCKYCKLHWTDYLFFSKRYEHAVCVSQDVSDIVDTVPKVGGIIISGMPSNRGELCILARKSYGPCGPNGKYFEEKSKW